MLLLLTVVQKQTFTNLLYLYIYFFALTANVMICVVCVASKKNFIDRQTVIFYFMYE